MPYAYPNWIVPPDLSGEFARGAQLGLEQARMQQQQEENQRQHLMEQQRLEVEKAYKDQQLAMQKQELDQATKLNQLKIQDAAQRMSAQKGFQDYVNSLGPNPDPDDIVRGILKFGTGMGVDSSGFYNLAAKQAALKHPFVPADITTPRGVNLVQLSPNRFEVAPDTKSKTADEAQKSKFALEDAYKQLDEARRAEVADVNPKHREANRKRVIDAMNHLKEIINPETATAKPSTPEAKVEAAKALRKAHPDWTKQQIIDAVNQ